MARPGQRERQRSASSPAHTVVQPLRTDKGRRLRFGYRLHRWLPTGRRPRAHRRLFPGSHRASQRRGAAFSSILAAPQATAERAAVDKMRSALIGSNTLSGHVPKAETGPPAPVLLADDREGVTCCDVDGGHDSPHLPLWDERGNGELQFLASDMTHTLRPRSRRRRADRVGRGQRRRQP
jgi:hypothetical protein